MVLLFYETTDKQIDAPYLQNQVDIRIWDIHFALVSANIHILFWIKYGK
jgi:hypothetical protein